MVRFLPWVITNSDESAEPRYASLPNIMKAKKKPIEKLQASDLGVDLTPLLEIVQISEPAKRVGGSKVCKTAARMSTEAYNNYLKVENVDELIAKLKEAGISAV
jgi:electron transfer flavoprotein beta subunit